MKLLPSFNLLGGHGHLLGSHPLDRHFADLGLGEPRITHFLVQGGDLLTGSGFKRLRQFIQPVGHHEDRPGGPAGRDIGKGEVDGIHPPARCVDDGEGIGALGALRGDGVAVVESADARASGEVELVSVRRLLCAMSIRCMSGATATTVADTAAHRLDRVVVGAPADSITDLQILLLGIKDLDMQAVGSRLPTKHAYCRRHASLTTAPETSSTSR